MRHAGVTAWPLHLCGFGAGLLNQHGFADWPLQQAGLGAGPLQQYGFSAGALQQFSDHTLVVVKGSLQVSPRLRQAAQGALGLLWLMDSRKDVLLCFHVAVPDGYSSQHAYHMRHVICGICQQRLPPQW